MRIARPVAVLVGLTWSLIAAGVCHAESAERLRELAAGATSDRSDEAKSAIAALRAAGPAGLQALLDANADAIRLHNDPKVASQQKPEQWQRIADAIDAVAAQKDAFASGLYWYTDFDAAKKAASKSGKPILSLRLLGTLDSEFSCANSRFFRTALYANKQVQAELRQHFVLHWKSVRPVPKVTIDFGDGRVIERTITGNSIHYVLDPHGRVIDAIPGLYGPQAFLERLTQATEAERGVRNLGRGDELLRNWHAMQSQRILKAWQADLARAGVNVAPPQPVVELVAANVNANGKPAAPPPAVRAEGRAVGKGKVERMLVVALDARAMELASDETAWQKIAALHADQARLDPGARTMIALKNPDAAQANKRSESKAFVETPLLRMVRNFEQSIALDTVRNEYTFHRQIHGWLAAVPGTKEAEFATDANALNERVYAELFLTPSSDPWLGLVPPDTYSALPNDGVCRK